MEEEIEKLKTRIAELEEEINKLRNELEWQIDKLTNKIYQIDYE